MRTRLAALLGAALGVGLALSVLAPASALPPASVTTASATQPADVRVAPAEAVSGAPWSAPAYPVECQASSGQVTCTPSDPASVTEQKCFMGVLYAGESYTVCTTYEGHAQALQNAGGTPLIVEYGCSLGDLVCVTFENAGRGMALSATAMMFLVADNMRFDTSTLLWDAAVDEWSFWQWAILIITFGAMVWAVAAAVVSGDREELVGALIRSFLAIPAVPLSLWLTGHLLNAIDDMTWYIVNRDGPFTLFSTLQSVMWAGGQANYFFAFLIHGLLMIGMLLLMLVFAFRNITLAALIAVGPVAWMLFPVRGLGPQWVVRYVSAVVVLLLSGPLTIGFVTLIINGLASVRTIWDPQSWPLLVGLVLVAFAPFAVFGLFSFVGAVAADGVGSRLGAHGARMTAGAASAAVRIPTRMGGRPSGVGPSGPSIPGGGARPGGSTGPARGGSAPSGSPSGSPRRPGPAGAQTLAPSTPAPRPGAAPAASSSPARPSGAPPQSPSAPAGRSPGKASS
ncbi:hypothetical protein [Microbacterium thalassium]|uniref:TrbL/VirB6 plasmid conjugal transfer protein n=1 Tax=Microbacterium thalassium TaxID=362649 RepID=A0A7X0KTD1_9MICO|nr:hypothetical protein [Microbacterium thalassium]MBB6389974.1 hypothetical protein [Microbacterium thalassium]GLK24660.1 hypothetical protein GCM10017607_19780 [Microbacterium thalassium]